MSPWSVALYAKVSAESRHDGGPLTTDNELYCARDKMKVYKEVQSPRFSVLRQPLWLYSEL